MVKNKAYAGRPPGLVIGIATLGILLLAGGADVAELPGDNVKLTYIIAPYITQPYIALEPASGTAGSGITVRGTGFDVSGEEFPQAAIYFDNRIVREGVWIEVDERGLGSFITSFTVPSGTNPGIYEVVAYGAKDAFASAEFEVESPFPPISTLSVSTSPSGLNPEPTGGGMYPSGEIAAVVAQPIKGYTFQRWTENGNQVSTSASYRFTVTEDRDLVAEYLPIPVPVIPSIALEPGSGTAGSEITVRGTGFDVSGEEFPQAAIYFDNRIVREGVWIEVDERGLGSFITSFTVPSGINPGIYEVVAYGPKDAFAPAEFEVEPFIPPWQTTPLVIFIIATFTIILAVVILKYLRNPGQLQINTQPQQINIETRGGSESMYESELRQYAINVEERGGIERLKKDEI
jgi:hypothetical protein